jgi:hypothetical protein
MSDDTIIIEYSLSKEDLICSLCLEELTLPIIQCANGNHFVGVKCKGYVLYVELESSFATSSLKQNLIHQ